MLRVIRRAYQQVVHAISGLLGAMLGIRTYCGERCILHVRLVHGLLKTKAVFSIELCFPQHFIALIERI